MSARFARPGGHPVFWVPLLCLLLVLGGCASGFTAQITRYQQWPGQTIDARYWIEPDSGQRNNLQFESFADAVRGAIGPTGLVQAQSAAQARFIVHLEYAGTREQRWEQRAVDPYAYGGFYGSMGYYHPWGMWGYGPVIETVPVERYRLSLTVRIDDRDRQSREVYRATAETISRSDNLAAAMPFLARAVFDRFPGANGEVVRVRYPLK